MLSAKFPEILESLQFCSCAQIKALGEENDRLKEKLSVIASGGSEQGAEFNANKVGRERKKMESL